MFTNFLKVKLRLRRGLALLAITMSVCGTSAGSPIHSTSASQAARPLTAFLGFNALPRHAALTWEPVNDYLNMDAGITFSEAVWGELSQLPRVDWVERAKIAAIRQELQLSAALSFAPAAQLQLSQQVSAEWLLTGDFFKTHPANTFSLRMQVIEIASADVLAETVIGDLGGSGKVLQVREADIHQAGLAAKRLFEDAERRMALARKCQGSLAVLFVRNVGEVPNLPHIGELLLTTLQAEADQKKLRLLCFPGAKETLGERQWMPADLARANPAAQSQVADAYVWLEYGATLTNRPFNRLPVRLDAWFFSGCRHEVISETGTMEDIQKIAERLMARITHDTFTKRQKAERGPPDHKVIADFLLQEARQHSTQGISAHINLIQRDWCSLACFFNPDSEQAWREYLACSYDTLPFLFRQLALSADWEWYLEQFGAAGLAKTNQPFVTTAGCYGDIAAAPVATAFYYYATVPDRVGRILKSPAQQLELSNLSDTVEKRFLWTITQTAPYLSEYYLDFGLMTGLLFLSEPQAKAQLCEMLVPRLGSDARGYYGRATKNEAIQQALRDAGWSEGKIQSFSIPPPPKRPSARGHSREMQPTSLTGVLLPQRLDVLPPRLNPSCRNVLFADHQGPAAIQALAWQNDALWISLKTNHPNLAGPPAGGLYCYMSPTNHALPAALFPGVGPPAFIKPAPPSGLWLPAADGTIYRASITDGSTTVYGKQDGAVLNTITDAGIDSAGELICCGPSGADNHGIIMRSQNQGASWRLIRPPLTGYGAFAPLDIHAAAVLDRLMVCGVSDQGVIFFDEDSEQWDMKTTVFRGISRSVPADSLTVATLIVSDETGFWIGSNKGLTHLDCHGKLIEHKIPPRGCVPSICDFSKMLASGLKLEKLFMPTTRLIGQITALTIDEDYLWVAVSTAGNHYANRENSPIEGFFVFLWHIPVKKWAGYFPVPAMVTALVAKKGHLWIGMNGHHVQAWTGIEAEFEEYQKSVKFNAGTPYPLIEIDTSPLYAIPEDARVSDAIPDSEIQAHITLCSLRDQIRYCFILGNYARTVQLLSASDDLTALDPEALLLLAWSYDTYGLNQPALRDKYLNEMRRRQPGGIWKRTVEEMLNNLPP